jgi:hypothetical protein
MATRTADVGVEEAVVGWIRARKANILIYTAPSGSIAKRLSAFVDVPVQSLSWFSWWPIIDIARFEFLHSAREGEAQVRFFHLIEY